MLSKEGPRLLIKPQYKLNWKIKVMVSRSRLVESFSKDFKIKIVGSSFPQLKIREEISHRTHIARNQRTHGKPPEICLLMNSPILTNSFSSNSMLFKSFSNCK